MHNKLEIKLINHYINCKSATILAVESKKAFINYYYFIRFIMAIDK